MLTINLLLLLAAQHALAQTIDYSQLPSCAQQCTLLTQANAACAAANPYLTCFCQSGYLKPFYQTPDGICNTVCPNESDDDAIQKWYLALCQNGAVITAAPTAAATTGAAAATSTVPAGDIFGSASTGTWWSSHYPWIIMVIVLLLGFGIIIWVGVCLKRRHIRKRNAANNTAPPFVWGPHQNQNATRGFDYPNRAASGKGKGRLARSTLPQVAENPVADGGESGGRMKKFFGR